MSRHIVIVCDVNGPYCWHRSEPGATEEHAEIAASSERWLIGDPERGDVCPPCRNQEKHSG